ncbi:unnamed protein product [Litomosoides sigmodontis]|uniref:Uncharacterized protein n=1 Tax=Litomosoides sigmodontis TaxID=42156 RepID=A0A3P7M7E2_LITSI|nr:unnamed protein product [Litomosoides sigmodontis]
MKHELQTTVDVIEEDNFGMISSNAATATTALHQHSCSKDLQTESVVRLSADYPTKSERQIFGNENGTELLAEDSTTIVELKQKCYIVDQDDRCNNECILKTFSPVPESLLPDDELEGTNDLEEELQDGANTFAHHHLPVRNDILSAIFLSTANQMSNDAPYNSLIKGISDFQSINHTNNSHATEVDGDNLKEQNLPKNEHLLENLAKMDDVRKISDKLEAFNKNNELSNVPVKTSRPKIEDTEMPTKGVVSNLKSLFESNAIHNSNDTCKSPSYKLEYGVGRSSGVLNKSVFH